MDKRRFESWAQPGLEGEEPPAALELTDKEPRPLIMPPAIHPLARKLGRLLANPRVTGDFFQTVWAVRQEVNREIPPRQIAEDARFLLRVFGQSGQRQPEPPSTQPVAPPLRPVLDTAARELSLQRSIASARTHNMATQFGLPADVAFMSQVLRSQE